MRSEENPLDLNNLPEDYYTKDGKLVVEDSSSYAAGGGGGRKKKSGGKEGKDECGKVYECRFCSLKFCKSQALGGHMNRHRQERETETLNRARQLVFNNDNTLLSQPPYLGGQSIAHGGGVGYQYHHGDPTLQTFRSIYPSSSSSSSSSTTATAARLFSAATTGGGSSSTSIFPPPPPPPYMYSSSSSSSRFIPFTSTNEYFLGHVLPHTTTTNTTTTTTPPSLSSPQQEMMIGNNYTCIGAPVSNGGREIMASSSSSANYIHQHHQYHNHNHNHNHDHEEGLMSWGSAGRSSCTGVGTQQQRLDPSSINRFQDGF